MAQTASVCSMWQAGERTGSTVTDRARRLICCIPAKGLAPSGLDNPEDPSNPLVLSKLILILFLVVIQSTLGALQSQTKGLVPTLTAQSIRRGGQRGKGRNSKCSSFRQTKEFHWRQHNGSGSWRGLQRSEGKGLDDEATGMVTMHKGPKIGCNGVENQQSDGQRGGKHYDGRAEEQWEDSASKMFKQGEAEPR